MIQQGRVDHEALLCSRLHSRAHPPRPHAAGAGVNIDPSQLLLTGQTHAQARLHPWLEGVDLPATVADLAVVWFACRPPPWKLGSYPVGHIRAARDRVRRLEREGWVRVEAGPLRHRRQVGVVVRGVR